jgi:hypothetical protein
MLRRINPVAVCAFALMSVAVAAVMASPRAQTPAPQAPASQTPTFRTRVDAVTVDVIATDKQGKPVTDLTAADFEIKENGKVQTVDNFKRILLTDEKYDLDPVRAQPITSMEAMEREAARDDVRLITIFLDDYHTRLGNSMAIREKLAKFVKELPSLMDQYEQLYTGNAIFRKRAEDVGVLTREAALNYAVSGPVLRGSGVAWDIRKDEPYSVYPEFDFEIPVGEKGDVLDRYEVRFFEMRMANEIVRQAMEGLPEGDFVAKLPSVIKPKAGEVYVRQEAARGELGCYLVSDGTSKPWRFHVHPPSFLNLGALDEMTRGYMFADLIMIFGSIDVVLGDVDK